MGLLEQRAFKNLSRGHLCGPMLRIQSHMLRRTYYWSRKSKEVVWVLPPLEVEKKKEG